MLRTLILGFLLNCNLANAKDDITHLINIDINPQHFKRAAHIAKDAADNSKLYKAQMGNLIKNAEVNNNKNVVNKDELFNDLSIENIEGTSLHDDLYVFISLSMPKEALRRYAALSNKYNYILVLQGLKDNNYLATISHIKQLIDEYKTGVIIHPDLFADFKITQVPSIVLSNNNQYDKLTGNVSIQYALEEFAKEGDLKHLAINRLNNI